MSAPTERIKIITDFQASQAVSEIQKLTLANQNLNAQLEQIDRKTKAGKIQYRETKAAIKENTAALNEHYKSLGNVGLNSNQLNAKLKNLHAQYKQLVPAAAGYTETEKKLRREIQDTTRVLEERNKGLKQTDSIFKQLKSQGPSALIGGLAGGVAAMLFTLAASIKTVVFSAIDNYGKLTDTLANMRKTTGLTEQGVESLNSKLGNINTRTAKKELQDIILIAGQMGIDNDQMLNFLKSTDKVTVALSDEFKGGAEQITNTFGALRNVFSDIKTQNAGDDILHIANAVNKLGAEGLATGPVVTDIANRIGSAGQVYGLTAGQTLGLAAAYQEMAIQTERGSTATVKILQKISAAPEEFAKIAGMGVKQFTKLVNTDISAAFLAVAKGFAASKGSATEFANKLADAEIGSAAISEVLSKVGQNTQLVTDKMKMATSALKDTSSIMDEFNIKNETFAADQEKAAKVTDRWMANLGKIGAGIIAPFIKILASMAFGTENLTDKFIEQNEKQKNLESSSVVLIKRYNELLPQISGNAEAQKELNKVMNEIATIAPGAATKFDAYGNVLAVNLGLLNQYIEKQKIANNALKWASIKEIGMANNVLGGERANLIKDLKSGNYAKELIGMNVVNKSADEAQKSYNRIQARLREINAEILKNKQLVKDFNTETKLKPEDTKPPKTTNFSNLSDEEKRKAEQLAEKRKENHAKVLADEAKMQIDSIQNDFEKKKAAAIEEHRLYVEEKQKELAEKAILQEDYDKAIKAKDSWLINQKEQIQKESEKKTTEKALQTAKTLAEAQVIEAENTGDEQTILAKKVALSIIEEQIAIFTAGEEAHSAIHQKFEAERQKLSVDLAKEAEKEKAKTRKEFEDAREKYEEKLADDKDKQEKTKEENLKEAKLNFKRKAAEVSSDLVFSFIKSGIDKELSEEDKKYQQLIQLNDDRLANNEISEEEHTKRKLEIENNHDAKVRELKRKQAIFDKAKAILDIAINTASGVVRAASGIVTAPMIPYIIATGAAEAALVAATPIPEFYTGGFIEPDNNSGVSGIKKPTPQARLIFAAEKGTEFMINNTGVRHPIFPQILPLIQKMNAGESINLGNSASSYSGTQTNGSVINNQETIQFFRELKSSIDKLNYNLENPVSPILSVGYKTAEEILDAANEVKSIISNASAA